MGNYNFKKIIAISNSSFLIHPLVFSVELLYEHAFPGFADLGVPTVDFLQNCYCHVVDFVARKVKMKTCGLIKVVVGHISFVVTEPLL